MGTLRLSLIGTFIPALLGGPGLVAVAQDAVAEAPTATMSPEAQALGSTNAPTTRR